MIRRFRVAVAALLVSLALAAPLATLGAQVGSTTDILMGRVLGPDGRPVEGARVEATSTETRIVRAKVTDANGKWTILFPDGGGQYGVTVRAVGYTPQTFALARQADEDRLVRDVTLGRAVTQLSAVQVRATTPAPNANAPSPGGTERVLTSQQLERLPVDGSDVTDLAALAPGVVALSASDSTAAGFSVAGQRPDQNQVTLDGVSFGGATVPVEAVRGMRVITSTFDVARGQFTGGQVASTTRGGTNVVQGSFGYSLRDPHLQTEDDAATTFGRGFTQHQLSGGLGGPIVRNKLFVFGAFQLRRRTDPLLSLAGADPLTLERLGVDPDSAARFLSLVRAVGLSPVAGGVSDDRIGDNGTALVRLDYMVAEGHTLALRGDWRFTGQTAGRIGSLSVPHVGGDSRSRGGGGMVTLSSHFGAGVINELRAYASSDARDSDPYVLLPDARVRVTSDLPATTSGASRGVSTLEFGTNPSLPQEGENTALEVTDELSWIPGDGAHRLKVGGLLNRARFDEAVTLNSLGTFTYNSLEDFAAARPASFTRNLSPRVREGGATTGALYVGDTWRKTRDLQLTLGLRLEGSRYDGAPAFNPVIDTLFARRTDRFPSEVRLSPRIGFTWTVPAPPPPRDTAQRGRGQRQNPAQRAQQRADRQGTRQAAQQAGLGGLGLPRWIVRGGVGEFRGRAPTSLFSSALDATGLSDAATQLVCIGDAVPAAEWAAYWEDPAAIPSSCASVGQPTDPAAARRRNVTVFADDFGAPRTWRASLGVTRRFLERYGFTVDLSAARGLKLYGVTDLNLDASPEFALDAEGGRPVFVPAGTIVPTTGQTSLAASRRMADRAELGQVLAVDSRLASTTAQATMSLNGFTRRGIMFNASYTLQRVRDQSSFSCCSAAQGFASPTAAGDPRAGEWATSDLERRHALLATVQVPVRPWLEVTSVGRLTSGQRFTPIVGGDINGDGARNDRAFIFDPSSAGDTAVASGMARLLAGAPDRARECLASQRGRVAARNSCAGPWTPSLDFQVNLRPAVAGLDRRLTVSLIAVNTLTGIDQLLHGDDDLRGWGQPARSDPTLLYVRGFDATTRRFVYQVNERFGDTRGARTAIRTPFQVALQARLTVGPDQTRDRIRQVFGQGGQQPGRAAQAAPSGAGTAAGSAAAANPIARMFRLPNPIDSLLAARDSLALTDAQVAALTPLRDTLSARAERLTQRVLDEVQRNGASLDPMSTFTQLRPRIAEGRAMVQEALDAAQRTLTPEQWAKVPDRVKQPLRRLDALMGRQ